MNEERPRYSPHFISEAGHFKEARILYGDSSDCKPDDKFKPINATGKKPKYKVRMPDLN